MQRILIIDDEPAVLTTFRLQLLRTGRYDVEVLEDSSQAEARLAAGCFHLVLLDMDMPVVHGMQVLQAARQQHPDTEVVVITGVDDVELAVEAMKAGAHDYLCKPVSEDRLVVTVERALERARMRREIVQLRERVSHRELQESEAFRGILTQNVAFLRVLKRAEHMGQSDNNVLIWGESGTGKELVARAIHTVSARRDKAFIAVNSGAFASQLFSSEFFGHERGAFTGAVARAVGFFEKADGGTLFLDEIGELELPVQSKLLRVLQEGEFFRVGSTQRRGADVRVVAATNKDLMEEMERGAFRRDLYHRLNICSVLLPPLRDRDGDVELLAQHFLAVHCNRNHKRIDCLSPQVVEALSAHDFPGNVRELDNIIAEATVMEEGTTLQLDALPAYLRKVAARPEARLSGEVKRTLAQVEEDHIRVVLAAAAGNRSATARILGISRMGLLAKMKRYGVE